jgi:hypothetical protein
MAPDVDALFRLLVAAPPRSLRVVSRVTLEGWSVEQLAEVYQVPMPQAQVLLMRALLDVESGGTARWSTIEEHAALTSLFGTPEKESAHALVRLKRRLESHRAELTLALEKAEADFAASPARAREETLRRVAIVVVLLLSAFFYWQERSRPLPPPERRSPPPALKP